MNTLVERILTRCQVWICSMCCLRAFSSLLWCRSTCELQGSLCPPVSGVAFYFQILLSLLCTHKHHPIPFLLLQGSVYLLVVSAVGHVAVLMQVHLRQFSAGDGVRAHWCRPGAGWQQAGRESVLLDFLGIGWCSLYSSCCRVDAVKCQPG